jgi:hypothetical protein
MPLLYDTLVKALTAHWKAHANAYPKRFVLTPAQVDQLHSERKVGHIAIGLGDREIDMATFMGARIEQVEGTPGVMVAVDGTEHAL